MDLRRHILSSSSSQRHGLLAIPIQWPLCSCICLCRWCWLALLPNILRPFTHDPYHVPCGGDSDLITATERHVALVLTSLESRWPWCHPFPELPQLPAHHFILQSHACHPRTPVMPRVGSSHQWHYMSTPLPHGSWLAQQWDPHTTESLGMAWLEVVHVQACGLVYVLQLQHILPILVPLLYLQNLCTCGDTEMVAAARPAPLASATQTLKNKVEVILPRVTKHSIWLFPYSVPPRCLTL